MSAVLLWLVGGFFLLISPFVTAHGAPRFAKVVSVVFAIVGALCWRFA